jgi:hypothetical protein
MSKGARWMVRPLTLADLPAFRKVRLDALRLHPGAYGSAYEEEAEYSLETMGARWPVAPGLVLGGFVGDRLVGIAGLLVEPRVKTRH